MSMKSKSVLMLLLVALIWGFSFVAVHYAIESGFGTFTILTLRGFFASVVLLPFLFKKSRYKNHMLPKATLAGFFFFLGFTFQTIGQSPALGGNIEISSFYTALYVIFTPFIALLFGRNELRLKNIISVLLAIVGVFTLSVLPSLVKGGELTFGLAEIFVSLGAVFFGCQIAFVSSKMKDCDPLAASTIMSMTIFVCSLIALPISAALGNEPMPTSLSGLPWIIYTGVLSSAFCTILQFIAQKRINSTRASLLLVLETPLAFMFSMLFGIAEISPAFSIPGLVLLLSGIFIAVYVHNPIDVSKYKYIFVDLDDTILDFKKAEKYAFKEMCEHYQIPYSKKLLEEYVIENGKMWQDYELDLITKEDIFDKRLVELFKRHNITADPKEASYYYLDCLAHYPFEVRHSVEALKSLHENHQIFLISNGEPTVQYPRIENAKIGEIFDKIYISSEIGVQKPKKEFFDYIINENNITDRSEILVIGDSLTSDIKGAINSGLDCCWLKRENKVVTDMKITYIVRDLGKLK